MVRTLIKDYNYTLLLQEDDNYLLENTTSKLGNNTLIFTFDDYDDIKYQVGLPKELKDRDTKKANIADLVNGVIDQILAEAQAN